MKDGPKDILWKEYEKITKYIYQTLGHQNGVKVIGFGNNCKVKGKSGIFHQIDVLTSHSDGIHEYQTAIECKYWEKKINKEIVMKLSEIIDDAGISKGVIVSKRGFTEDGAKFARYKNIGLVELREVDERDRVKSTNPPRITVAGGILTTNVERIRPEVLSFEVDCAERPFIPVDSDIQKMTLQLESGLVIPLNEYLKTFKQLLHEKQPGEIMKKHYEFKRSILIHEKTGRTFQIDGFTITGKLEKLNWSNKQNIEIVDEVWMIMKTIFEGNSYKISKSGIIKKD
jgi:hypothetical protein